MPFAHHCEHTTRTHCARLLRCAYAPHKPDQAHVHNPHGTQQTDKRVHPCANGHVTEHITSKRHRVEQKAKRHEISQTCRGGRAGTVVCVPPVMKFENSRFQTSPRSSPRKRKLIVFLKENNSLFSFLFVVFSAPFTAPYYNKSPNYRYL